MTTVRESYSVGDTATLVGYVQAKHTKPRAAFIRAQPSGTETSDDVELLPIGEIKFTRTDHKGYFRLRAYLQFVVPETLSPGLYRIDYDTEDGKVGDLVGGNIYVDMDPPRRIRREWALDEPEIANLANRGIIQLPSKWITAKNLREGGIELAVPNGSRATTTTTTTTEPVAQSPVVSTVTPTSAVPPNTASLEDSAAISAATNPDASNGFGWLAALALLMAALAAAVLLYRRRSSLQTHADDAAFIDGHDGLTGSDDGSDLVDFDIRSSDFVAQLSDRYG